MSVYKYLANELLNLVHNDEKWFHWQRYQNNSISFKYMKDYKGRMAEINEEYANYARKKQGYYDIKAFLGPWGYMTHTELFKLLLDNFELSDCEQVWRGELPENIETNPYKKAILCSLALLMFEQEVNFGNEDWQRKSQFNPDIKNPNFRRPRDLLMGYIKIIFEKNDVSCINKYKSAKGQLVPPKSDDIKKEYFAIYENDHSAAALMTGDILEKFKTHIEDKDINPYFKNMNPLDYWNNDAPYTTNEKNLVYERYQNSYEICTKCGSSFEKGAFSGAYCYRCENSFE